MEKNTFYRFLENNEIEHHTTENYETHEMDVIIFPKYWQIEDLSKLLKKSAFDDEGIPCRIKDGYVAIWASDILD